MMTTPKCLIKLERPTTGRKIQHMIDGVESQGYLVKSNNITSCTVVIEYTRKTWGHQGERQNLEPGKSPNSAGYTLVIMECRYAKAIFFRVIPTLLEDFRDENFGDFRNQVWTASSYTSHPLRRFINAASLPSIHSEYKSFILSTFSKKKKKKKSSGIYFF